MGGIDLPWLYSGCEPRTTGHYLFTQKAYGSSPLAWSQKMSWDGKLAPQPIALFKAPHS